MSVEYLFDSAGRWIAFRVENNWVWSSEVEWIGWCPWSDDPACVVDSSGDYLGHVVGNRLLRFSYHPYRGYPGYPGYPPYPGYPGYPGFAGYYALPSGMEDLPEGVLSRE